MTKTLILVIQYDGTNYAGWQIQPNAPTIQAHIENALEHITQTEYRIVGAGRTDAGVHARGQVAHTNIEDNFNIPEHKICSAINSKLPDDIRIVAANIVPNSFHARFDAIAREYSYTIYTQTDVFMRNYANLIKYPFDPIILNEASEVFIGKHNFTTYSKINESVDNYVCNVSICSWNRINDYSWRLQIKSDRFVYGMVRSLVGAMIDAARGKYSVIDVFNFLNLQDRSLASPLAAPQGLVLEKIYY